VRIERSSSETGAVVETAWSPARQAVLIASERITDEPWREIDEGTLLRVDRLPAPVCVEIPLRRA
jgi:predicted glutamine amidotransferase